jgi:uncharacterized membrane protein YtjA (UPF0391 family)
MGLLKWALICLLISLVAGAFGYTDLARGAAQISKILFFLFLVLFIVILILAITAGEIIFEPNLMPRLATARSSTAPVLRGSARSSS